MLHDLSVRLGGREQRFLEALRSRRVGVDLRDVCTKHGPSFRSWRSPYRTIWGSRTPVSPGIIRGDERLHTLSKAREDRSWLAAGRSLQAGAGTLLLFLLLPFPL